MPSPMRHKSIAHHSPQDQIHFSSLYFNPWKKVTKNIIKAALKSISSFCFILTFKHQRVTPLDMVATFVWFTTVLQQRSRRLHWLAGVALPSKKDFVGEALSDALNWVERRYRLLSIEGEERRHELSIISYTEVTGLLFFP